MEKTELAKRISDAMKRKGLSILDFSEVADIQVSYACNILNDGKGITNPEILARIAKVLEIPLEDLKKLNNTVLKNIELAKLDAEYRERQIAIIKKYM